MSRLKIIKEYYSRGLNYEEAIKESKKDDNYRLFDAKKCFANFWKQVMNGETNE